MRRLIVGLLFLLTFATVRSATASVTRDANGWTVVAPSADSLVIYVSDSEGNDQNDGLSEAAAKKTIAAGYALMRNGYPDHLLLKRGDTFQNQGLGNADSKLLISGRSCSEPLLFGAYGVGARPILNWEHDASHSPVDLHLGNPPTRANYVFIGIDFYAYARDPSNPAYNPTSETFTGLKIRKPPGCVIIEDNRVRWFRDDIEIFNLTPGAGTLKDVWIRRNIVENNWSETSHGQGAYIGESQNIIIDGNVFYHNGWKDTRDSTATIFNHAFYIDATASNVTMFGNTVLDPSSHGVQLRPGGRLQGNLFAETPLGIQLGYIAQPVTGIETSTCSDNVVSGAGDINSTTPRGEGISGYGNSGEGGGVIINNVVSHGDGGVPWGIELSTKGSIPVAWSVHGNIFWNHGAGSTHISPTSGPVVATISGNYDCCGGTVWPGDFDSDATVWPDPTRTVGSYNAFLGGVGTYAAFVSEVLQQSSQYWRYSYTASAAVDWIRAGFGLGSVDPDQDTIPNGLDYCTLVSDPNQTDSDSDGYGNRCDADYDNDGTVGGADINKMRLCFGKSASYVLLDGSTCEETDFDGNGIIGAPDFNFLRTSFGSPPGPSCCGTLSVPAPTGQ